MKNFALLLSISLFIIGYASQIRKPDDKFESLQASNSKIDLKLKKTDDLLLGKKSSESPAENEITTFTIMGPQGGEASLLFTANNIKSLEMKLDSNGDFTIKNSQSKVMAFNEAQNQIDIMTDILKTKNIQFDGELLYTNVPQWRLVINENFWSPPTGWSLNEISTCGGVYLLGGYAILSRGKLQKELTNLPAHTILRMTADFHYIDSWTGETAYAQLNIGPNKQNEYVWTDRYDSAMAINSINVCGARCGEGKFTTKIDITVPHTDESIIVTFGSTVDQDPADQSWGISNLSIYVM